MLIVTSHTLFASERFSQRDPLAAGAAAYSRGDYAKSLQIYTIALKSDPKNTTLLYNRGLTLSMLEDYPAALRDFDLVIQGEPQNDSALFNRAIVRYKLKDYLGAVQDLDRTLQLYPDDAKAMLNRALANMELGDLSGARRDAQSASKIFKTYGRRGKSGLAEAQSILNELANRSVEPATQQSK